MLRKRLVVVAALLFFFGFPLAGLLFVYFRAHDTIRATARPFVEETTDEVLSGRDYDSLYFYGTLTLKGTLKEQTFVAWFDGLGDYKRLRGLKPVRSWVGARADQNWQFVSFVATAEFENGDAALDVTAARRSTALTEWRIEAFSLAP